MFENAKQSQLTMIFDIIFYLLMMFSQFHDEINEIVSTTIKTFIHSIKTFIQTIKTFFIKFEKMFMLTIVYHNYSQYLYMIALVYHNYLQYMYMIALAYHDCSQKECVICLNELKSGFINLNCSIEHLFHKKCLSKWIEFNMTCPLCRSPIINNDLMILNSK